MQYRVTYRPGGTLPVATIEADRHSVEATGSSLVVRAVRRVPFTEREGWLPAGWMGLPIRQVWVGHPT